MVRCVLCGSREAKQNSLICGVCSLKVHYRTDERFRMLRKVFNLYVLSNVRSIRKISEELGVSEITAKRLVSDVEYYLGVAYAATE